MNPHKIEVPCCIERTNAAGIKEGNLCLRGKYITTVPGGDTKMSSRCIFLEYFFGFALFESIAG